MNDETIKVLLVEDNPGDAHLIQEMLAEGTGALFDLVWVDRLSTGLERLAEGGIDLVLLDLSLPDSRGLETFSTADAQAPHVPIIVLTSLDDEEVAVDAVREGAQDYLVKGQVDGNMLMRAMQYAIERKRAEEEKRKLEAELRQAQKMEAIGTLAGSIAHEFNNILGIILGNTDSALDCIPEWSPARYNLDGVRKACLRAKDVVKQILIFSRQSVEGKKPLQISLVVKDALKLLRASLPTTIEIRQNIQDQVGTILADPTLIHQVMMNLCINAAHAMRQKDGVLEVSLVDLELDADAVAQYPDLTPGSYLRLSVSDTGHGIEPEIIDRIFDPYFTTKGLAEGTGMGLAVVQGTVKSHGGVITVQSKPGEGTTFHIFFPRIESQVTPKSEVATPLPRGNERILFVDDEEMLADMGQRMLERLGYEVVATTVSVKALESFRAQPDKFDLVITDQTMPHMTGEMLAKELIRIRPDIPIILCTGFSEAITPERAKAMGIREFMMKPIDTSELGKSIRRVLDHKP
ncbi:MAG: response regulator [Deltaproteobacteria bacterium]|nr:response regulator [Deltaproteobacteria bacterium]MBW2021071.1 response regulator [Deltaproteobacteria bacterium]MBW2075756.1 response regulator [Deltaproteobacteria bacterium]RLB79853.1 MAG: histidine kinase [Deltaproteobacteria bacterium]